MSGISGLKSATPFLRALRTSGMAALLLSFPAALTTPFRYSSAASGEGLNIMSALKKRTRSSLILYACSPTVLTGTA